MITDNYSNYMLSLITPNVSKPDRLKTSEKEKNTEPNYSLDMAKWVVNNANNIKYVDHVNRIYINRNFYKNKQWIFNEDLEAFLKDESGLDRNRLRVTMNLIQQMGNMYRGTVDKMDFKGRVKSYSPNVKTRRDAKLEEMLYWGDVAKHNENLRSYIQNQFPVGKTEDETRQIFENVYKDKMVKGMNNLLAYGLQVNRFDKFNQEVAEDEFCSGMVVMQPYASGGEWMFKRIPANQFFFDRAAIEYDLSDASYMGHWEKMMPTEIYERFPDMDGDDRIAIEQWVANFASNGFDNTTVGIDGRVPVFYAKWYDCTQDWYGYVKTEFDEIELKRLYYIPEGQIEPTYTDKDLIKNKDLSPYQRKVLKCSPNEKKKNKTKLVVDYWRECVFIPQVYAGITSKNTYSKGQGDIVLKYGICEYGEPDLYSPTNMRPPYKVNFYMYLDGEVISPVDIAVNPQRMINRFLSVFENQINNSGGSNIVYDPDMVEDELTFLSNVKRSEPTAIRTKGMPIQNVVGRYDNSIGAGAAALIQYANTFKTFTEEITGVNNAVKGQASNEQLVGVMQLQIQKGTLLQEPFYKCIENVYQDCFQNIISAGKRFYLDNKERLVIAVGEEDTYVLELTEDMRYEDALVEVKRSAEPDKERMAIDAAIISYYQLQLLNDIDVANLTGRANYDDLYAALRDRAKAKIEIQRMASEQARAVQEQQAIQLQQQGQMIAAKEQKDKTEGVINKKDDQQHELDKILLQKGIDAQAQQNNKTQQVAQAQS